MSSAALPSCYAVHASDLTIIADALSMPLWYSSSLARRKRINQSLGGFIRAEKGGGGAS